MPGTPEQPDSGKPAESPKRDTTQGDFIGEAKNFIKNPLGIIGLFVVLVYSVATIMGGLLMKDGPTPTTQDHITNAAWLIQFIVWFPVLVLLIFTLLVVFCHENLYGPSDFLDPKDWIELQKVLHDIDKQQDQLTRELGARATEFAEQNRNIQKAQAIVGKALGKALGFP